MMKRIEILARYDVDVRTGIIQSPGKYEGELIYAPYFHEAIADGYAEELSFMEDGSGEYAALVEITDADRNEFPEIGAARYMLVTEDDQGFVRVRQVATEDDADRIREDYELDEEDEPDEEDDDE